MQHSASWISVALLLSGCATPPIIVTNVPEGDIADCQAISERRDDTRNVAEHAVVQGAARGILGGAVESAVAGTGMTLKILSYKAVGSFAAGSLAWPLALLGIGEGIASGVHENAKEKERIVRECLRDLGHRVY